MNAEEVSVVVYPQIRWGPVFSIESFSHSGRTSERQGTVSALRCLTAIFLTAKRVCSMQGMRY